MKYKRVRPNSYAWLKWIYISWFMILISFVALYNRAGKKTVVLLGIVAMVLIGVMFIATAPKIIKARKVPRRIHNHIKENKLCQMEIVDNKKKYAFYPKIWWRIDKSANTLFIRFRLTGNQINLRGLEQGLADRLETICLNTFEQRGYIEYLLELEEEKQLVIKSEDDIQGNFGDTEIILSPSFIWNYQKIPHMLLAGTSGSGKTTLARYLILNLITRGVRVVYVDIKHDSHMEWFCHKNAINYAGEAESIANAIKEVADELQGRTVEIERMGVGEDFDDFFNPIYLICDEIILMKLLFPKKLYDETIARINSIIVGGRSKAIYCGMISQSALAEYFGNSGIRGNIGLKVALGQMTPTELGMIFGNEYSNVKNLRYGEIGSGLIMRNGIDSRPREIVVPYIKKRD